MKKIIISYNPINKTFNICKHLHKKFCQEGSKTTNIDGVISELDKLEHKREIEFIVEEIMPQKDKDKIKEYLQNTFEKIHYKEESFGPSYSV